MPVSPRSSIVSLIDDLVRVKRGREDGAASPRPILILEGVGGSGRTRLLDDTYRRWKGKAPLAEVDPPGGDGSDSMRPVLEAVMLGLTEEVHGYRVSFPRVVLAYIAMASPIDGADPEQRLRALRQRLNTYQDPSLVTPLLRRLPGLVAGKFIDAGQLDEMLKEMTDRLRKTRWRSKLIWRDALAWFAHQDLGHRQDPERALIRLSLQADETDPAVRKDVDELLMRALLADLRESFARAANHPYRAVVLLDNGDAPSVGRFLTTLAEVRDRLALHKVAQDPLIVITTSNGYHLAKTVGLSSREAQWRESALANRSGSVLGEAGPWLRIRLDGLAAGVVEDMVEEDVTQWPASLGRSTITNAVMRLTGGHAMATDLVLARLRQNPGLIDDLGRVLSDHAPNSMADSLIETIAADLSPQQGLHEHLREALITLAGARDSEEAQCLRPLLDETVRDK